MSDQPRAAWPRRWVLTTAAVSVFLIAAVTAVVVVLLASDDDHVVDEQAWRAAREAQLGHPFKDWPTYRDIWIDRCENTKDLDMSFGLMLDDGVEVEEMRTDLAYGCPGRLPELDAYLKRAADPCAGYDAEARERIEEASGVPC